MIETDIVVVGAGPAGSTAAKHAALGGARVILIDKKSEIGTPKRCAEGVYDHGFKWLGIEIDPMWVSQRINGGTLIAPDNTRITLDETVLPEKGYIIERKVFDKYMAMDAGRAGSKIMIKTLVKSIERQSDDDGDFFIVICEHMGEIFEIKARIVIAADGPESHIARCIGINSSTKPFDMMSGVQYEMVGVECERMDLLELHLGAFAQGGYAWIFPKGEDSANVGIGIDASNEYLAIDLLNEFVETYPPLKNAKAVGLNIGGIPVGGMIERIYDDNFLACGDAAGQVNPITGGGIVLGMLGGMCAGRVAAKAIKEGDYSAKALEEYEELYKEKSRGIIPKLTVGREVYESLDEDDINKVFEAFADLDYSEMDAKDVLKVFLKLPKRLALKFRKLFKLIYK